MKKLIIILLSIQFCLLIATDGDQLDLGNVVIQGETESLEDTVGSERDLTEYCAVASTEQFEYSAYYSPMVIESPTQYPIQEITALQFKGGLENFTGVNGVISYGNIWKFSAEFLNRERSENWKEKTYSMQWQPQIKQHNFILNYSNKEFVSDSTDTDISGGYLSYSREGFVIPQIPKISWDLELKSAYYEFTQLQDSASDFDLNTRIGVKYNNLFADVNVNLLKQKASGYVDAGISSLKIFDNIGLWFAYDEDGVYPSVNFHTKLSLYKNLAIKFENKPTISTNSRIDGFNENLLQNIFPGDLQTKKILNSFITLESDHLLPLSLYYNPSLVQDHLIYSDDANGFYEQENIDCFIHTMGLKAAYKLGDLTLIQNVEYKKSDEQLYYEPLLTASTKLEYVTNSYRFGVDLRFLRDGVDENEQDLDDTMLLDVSALYKLRNNISLMAEARNLLNQEYQKYNNYIAEELQLIFGVKMTF